MRKTNNFLFQHFVSSLKSIRFLFVFVLFLSAFFCWMVLSSPISPENRIFFIVLIGFAFISLPFFVMAIYSIDEAVPDEMKRIASEYERLKINKNSISSRLHFEGSTQHSLDAVAATNAVSLHNKNVSSLKDRLISLKSHWSYKDFATSPEAQRLPCVEAIELLYITHVPTATKLYSKMQLNRKSECAKRRFLTEN